MGRGRAQLDGIAQSQVGDDNGRAGRIARTGDIEEILALPAGQGVARAAGEGVIENTADQGLGAIGAFQDYPGLGGCGVDDLEAGNRRRSPRQVKAAGDHQGVRARTAVQGAARLVVNAVVAGAAGDAVRATAAHENIVAAGTGDAVVAGGADDGHACTGDERCIDILCRIDRIARHSQLAGSGGDGHARKIDTHGIAAGVAGESEGLAACRDGREGISELAQHHLSGSGDQIPADIGRHHVDGSIRSGGIAGGFEQNASQDVLVGVQRNISAAERQHAIGIGYGDAGGGGHRLGAGGKGQAVALLGIAQSYRQLSQRLAVHIGYGSVGGDGNAIGIEGLHEAYGDAAAAGNEAIQVHHRRIRCGGDADGAAREGERHADIVGNDELDGAGLGAGAIAAVLISNGLQGGLEIGQTGRAGQGQTPGMAVVAGADAVGQCPPHQ